jgi:biotin transport system substrate-specific component
MPVHAWIANVPLSKVLVTDAIFLPGDLLKAGIAAVVTRAVVRAYPQAGLGTTRPREHAGTP